MANKGLIIVDYQNTFADKQYKRSPRELYVDHGETLVDTINDHIDKTKQDGGIILASREIHSAGHMYFASSYKGKMPITIASTIDLTKGVLTLKDIENWTEENNGLTSTAGFSIEELREVLASNGGEILLWPDHCVEGTRGADYYGLLNSSLIDQEVIKGRGTKDHPYTGFGGDNTQGESLIEIIQGYGIEEVDVLGLATDYCVNDTVMDALKFKLKTNLILAGSAGVYPVGTYNAIKEMEKAGANII